MKKIGLTLITLSAFSFSAVVHANPKCNHRLASAGNELLRSTNPKKETKTTTNVKMTGSARQKQGTQ